MNSRQPATTTKPTDPSGRFAHLHHRAQDPVLSGTSGHWPSDYVASSATSPSFPNSKSSSLSPSAPCRPPSRVSELFSGLKNTLMTSNLQTSASTGNQSSVAGCAEDPGLLELVLSANNFGAIDCSTTASCLKETGSLKFCQGKRISPAASSNVLLLKETWRTPSTLSPGLRKSRSDSGNIDSLHECIWEQNDGCLEVEANSVEEGERRLFSSILSLPCS
ncbi:unnamed protein product [Protopolystoma xenopodis]|uniref:Uncharacterized protein n=1 Tax=Protopolystoma xenopodis TaxID=117903 RepID=A0A3S5BC87_9PLAT|nr:unnamed protein product [Protopolystoma xenopodis]